MSRLARPPPDGHFTSGAPRTTAATTVASVVADTSDLALSPDGREVVANGFKSGVGDRQVGYSTTDLTELRIYTTSPFAAAAAFRGDGFLATGFGFDPQIVLFPAAGFPRSRNCHHRCPRSCHRHRPAANELVRVKAYKRYPFELQVGYLEHRQVQSSSKIWASALSGGDGMDAGFAWYRRLFLAGTGDLYGQHGEIMVNK